MIDGVLQYQRMPYDFSPRLDVSIYRMGGKFRGSKLSWFTCFFHILKISCVLLFVARKSKFCRCGHLVNY